MLAWLVSESHRHRVRLTPPASLSEKVLSSVLFPLSPNGCECQCASRCQHQGKPQSEIGAVSRLWCVGAVSITVCCRSVVAVCIVCCSRSRCFCVFISSEYPRPGECYIIRNNLFFNLVISFKIPCPPSTATLV